QMLQEAGLMVTGVTSDHSLVESVQWAGHVWGVGVQFHPEFKSKPTEAHPLFAAFVKQSIANRSRRGARVHAEAGA
ncbi:MAG: glutamine amidotransferase-related protein, partial [Spirochaetota bacterium]